MRIRSMSLVPLVAACRAPVSLTAFASAALLFCVNAGCDTSTGRTTSSGSSGAPGSGGKGEGGTVSSGGTSAGGQGGAPGSGGSMPDASIGNGGAGSPGSGGTTAPTGGGGIVADRPGAGGSSETGGTSTPGTTGGAAGATRTGGATSAGGGSGGRAGASGSGGQGMAGGTSGSGGSSGGSTGSTLLAATPPMGWNSWNYFKANISDSVIRQIADAMVSSGMKDVGYTYVNIDDTWMKAGRVNGLLVPDSRKFPNGMKALADYVHSRGLKLGIYGDRGTMTCANIAESGSYGRETEDAQTFASWGIDYLKYDNCNVGSRTGNAQLQQDYEKMGAALRATGRPIIYSLCAWGWKGDWMIETGQLWRSTGDIADCWDNSCSIKASYENGITAIIDQNEAMASHAGPGHWNDPDMLEVGNGHMTTTEYISHFSLWCIMAAPLIAGNDIRNMSTTTRDILTNQEAIAVDQDPAGIQGRRIVDNGDLEVWMKPLGRRDGPEKAVVLFNRSSRAATISVSLSAIGISGSVKVRDLWAHKDLTPATGSFSAEVESHGVVMVKITQTGS